MDFIEQRLKSDPVARKILAMDETATRELGTQVTAGFDSHMVYQWAGKCSTVRLGRRFQSHPQVRTAKTFLQFPLAPLRAVA